MSLFTHWIRSSLQEIQCLPEALAILTSIANFICFIGLAHSQTWRDFLDKQLDRLNQCHGQKVRWLQRTDHFNADLTEKTLFHQNDSITVPNLKRNKKVTRFMVMMILNFGLFVTEKQSHSGWFLIILSQTDYLQSQPTILSSYAQGWQKSCINKVKFPSLWATHK